MFFSFLASGVLLLTAHAGSSLTKVLEELVAVIILNTSFEH